MTINFKSVAVAICLGVVSSNALAEKPLSARDQARQKLANWVDANVKKDQKGRVSMKEESMGYRHYKGHQSDGSPCSLVVINSLSLPVGHGFGDTYRTRDVDFYLFKGWDFELRPDESMSFGDGLVDVYSLAPMGKDGEPVTSDGWNGDESLSITSSLIQISTFFNVVGDNNKLIPSEVRELTLQLDSNGEVLSAKGSKGQKKFQTCLMN